MLTPGSWKRLLPKVLELARVTGDDNLMTNAQSCAGTCEVRPDKVHTVHVSEPFGYGKHRGLLMEDEAVLTFASNAAAFLRARCTSWT